MAEVVDRGGRWPAARWRMLGWGGALAILLAPLVAMAFTEAVAWGPGDFRLAAGLAQVLAGSLAGSMAPPGSAGLATLLPCLPWLLSAALFDRAARHLAAEARRPLDR